MTELVSYCEAIHALERVSARHISLLTALEALLMTWEARIHHVGSLPARGAIIACCQQELADVIATYRTR